MFQLSSAYSFSLLKCEKKVPAPILERRTYKFRNVKRRIYHAIVERYDHDFYVIKFFAVRMIQSERRYQVMYNDGDAIRVICTCLAIGKEIHKRNEYASFGFLGMNNPDEKTTEDTKRYRVYKGAFVRNFEGENWLHKDVSRYSCYAAINNNNFDPNLFDKIYDILASEYDFNEMFIID